MNGPRHLLHGLVHGVNDTGILVKVLIIEDQRNVTVCELEQVLAAFVEQVEVGL